MATEITTELQDQLKKICSTCTNRVPCQCQYCKSENQRCGGGCGIEFTIKSFEKCRETASSRYANKGLKEVEICD